MRARPTHEVWITISDEHQRVIGESLIGLVYTDEEGGTTEVLAAVPMPETKVEYRPIRSRLAPVRD